MNFHAVNLHHKYQTFKSQTNGDQIDIEFQTVRGTSRQPVRGCRPHFINLKVMFAVLKFARQHSQNHPAKTF